jgi:NAD(P)H-quinone oxidoreductase subunit 5
MNLLDSASSLASLPLWQVALVLGPVLASALAATATATAPNAGPSSGVPVAWRAARWATAASLLFATLSLGAVLAGSRGSVWGWRADVLGAAVMWLVSFVGWVIVRYSQSYLNGEPQERHYVCWLMATLAAVGVVIATNHVLVLTLAWMVSSLALHRLLTFFGSRPAAVVAAHKKFIVSRAADVCMLLATALLFHAFGTLRMDEIALRVASVATSTSGLPWSAQAAALLLACAALLKCAQLPFHGWLIQVMEAPTPVSALLHAGVVNLGGFVLMRFAGLVTEVPAAQVLLVLAGTTTAVLAALVMTTRISIKVSLAWSTTAQMGFMLMQCGLGAWDMALLHLLAHSLYKAHAFLAAGGAVRRAQLADLTPHAAVPGYGALALGALVGVGMTLTAAALWKLQPWTSASAQTAQLSFEPASVLSNPGTWVLPAILALALVPLVHAQTWRLRGLWLAALGSGAFAVALAYFALQALLLGTVLPTPHRSADPAMGLGTAVALAFALLFVLQSVVTVSPQGALGRLLYPWFYGGLFVDEKFNRIAFALWQPPWPRPEPRQLPKFEHASEPASEHTAEHTAAPVKTTQAASTQAGATT